MEAGPRCWSLGCASAAAEQIDDYHHQRYNQQQVNQTSGHMQAETQQPQNQKHSNNCPKHINLLVYLPLSCILALDLKGSERFAALETKLLGARGDQPTKWAHPL